MSKKLFNQNDLIYVLLGPLIGLSGIMVITGFITYLGQLAWQGVPIEWPEVLNSGGLIGGFIASILILTEKYLLHETVLTFNEINNRTSDLYFLIFLLFFTYILELLVENTLSQVIIFLVYIGFVTIIIHDLLKWIATFFSD